MAIRIQSTNVTGNAASGSDGINLASNSTLYVLNTANVGAIAVGGDGVSGAGSVSVYIYGTVFSAEGDGIDLGSMSSVFLSRNATVNGAINGLRVASSVVENNGTITAEQSYGINAFGGGNSIINRGDVSGSDGGIRIAGGNNVVKNYGSIVSSGGPEILVSSVAGQTNTIFNYGTLTNGIVGSAGNDIVLNLGKCWNDIDLGGGNDRYRGIDGGFSWGWILGGAGDDNFGGSNWNEEFYGGDNNDVLNGNGGNDGLNGENGTDQMSGGSGDDLLDGGAGADTLRGGLGDDELTGGAASDVFQFGRLGGTDTIYDFTDEIDTLSLSGSGLGVSSAAEVTENAKIVAGDTVITFATGDVLILDNFADPSLLSNDIVIV